MTHPDDWDSWVEHYTATRPPSTFESTANFLLRHGTRDACHLDLGCGAGGLSIACERMGLRSEGIDLSQAMIEAARSLATQSDSSAKFEVGDMRSFGEPNSFDVVTCLGGTLFQLLTADEQAEVFVNAYRVLRPSGLFVVGSYIPGSEFLFPAKSLTVRQVLDDGVELSVTQVNRVLQLAEFRELSIRDGKLPEVRSTRQHYRWPGELDAVASSVGFSLESQFQDVEETPVSSKSQQRIQLLRKVVE